MIALLRAADVRAQDAAAGDVSALMERAGHAVAHAARAVLGRTYGARIVVICGPGNNGGDGLVAARILEGWGARVDRVMPGGAHRGSLPASVPAQPSPMGLEHALGQAELAIDAIFGVGLSRAPEGPFAAAVEALNGFEGPVLAVDVPSGVDADTGAVPGVAVRADTTVTFTGPKPGLWFEPGVAYAGRVTVASIGLTSDTGSAWALTRDDVGELLPVRAADAHKARSGRVLVIAGSSAMPGAAALATLGSVRAGAGLTQLAAPDDVCRVVAGHVAEATTIPLSSSEGVLDLKGLEAIRPHLQDAAAVVIGPGLGRHPATGDAVRAVLTETGAPVVVDADALHAVQGHLEVVRGRAAPTVFTPHAGEFARTFHEITDRLHDAETASSLSGAIVVLKGPGTVIAGGDRSYVNPTGDAGLAQGGSGDVLAGAIGAFLAQSSANVARTVAAAVWIHGRAAERLGRRRHPQPATASDLARELGPAMHEVLHG